MSRSATLDVIHRFSMTLHAGFAYHVLVCLLVATLLAFSQIHRLHSADSLVPVLASLYAWEPFYWEQDRVGWLIPLMLCWCKAPFANLLLQTGAMAFFALVLPLVLVRTWTHNRLAFSAVMGGNAFFLAFAPDEIQQNWFLLCTYPLALVLALPTAGLLESQGSRFRRIAATFVLLILAHWVYIGVCIFVLPWIAFRCWCRSRPGEENISFWKRGLRPVLHPSTRLHLILVGVALGTNALAMHLANQSAVLHSSTSGRGVEMADWPTHWMKMLAVPLGYPGSAECLLAYGFVAAIGIPLGWIRNRVAFRAVGRALLPFGLAAVVEFLFLGTREWLPLNLYHPRYLVAGIATGLVAISTLSLLPLLERWASSSRIFTLASTVALVIAALVRHGPISPEQIRSEYAARMGTYTPEVLNDRCDAIGGDYWFVWPAVFHANWMLAEKGETRVISGVGQRCAPWRSRWQAFGPPGFRVLVRKRDVWLCDWAGRTRGLAPLTLEATGEDFEIHRTRWIGR